MQHHFDVELATRYGILEAVLLNHFAFWIQHNEANGVNFHDGTFWTFNSIKALQEIFPYVSERTIRYALNALKTDGLIITSNFNKDPRDRTTWYALTDKGKAILQNCQLHSVNLSNEVGKSVKPLPDNDSDIYTDIKRNISKRNAKTFVPPTLEEVSEYVRQRNSSVDPKYFYDYFTTGEWIDSNGKPVRNWKQKLITWEKGNGGKPNNGHAPKSDKQWNIHYDNE